jgi:glycosyltransferase involved in cell wall biosynthesis
MSKNSDLGHENSHIELTILMPCLNEAETIEICVRKATAFLIRSGVRGEVLVADNGSTDASAQLAAANGARVGTEFGRLAGATS